MVNEKNVIELKHLYCKAGSRVLLGDISWSVKAGEHWIVFGMNGSGKTTLLSIIAGFNNYSKGTLRVFGEDFTAENILDLRKRIGWVSSSFFDKCYRNETVLDIVLSGLTGTLGVAGMRTDRDVYKAQQLLSELRIGDKAEAPFSTLSKGERQNVLIARAMIAKPDILVLDEPGTGLDIYARESMLSAVQTLAETTDITIIYVTHYVDEILPAFDKTLLLRKGHIYKQGNTRELFTDENLSRFLRHPVEMEMVADRYYATMQVGSRLPDLAGYQEVNKDGC